MKVLIDLHHDELHESLLKLFSDRFGFDVYTPIGEEWYLEGYWVISHLTQTIKQYLYIDDTDKTLWIEQTPGIFYKTDGSRYRKNFKYVKLNCAKELQFDIIIVSHPSQFEYLNEFRKKFCRNAKMIFQLGNMTPTLPENCRNVLNSTSSDYYLPDIKNLNWINYNQEFDHSQFDIHTIPENINTINI